ncbi:hypothetical protein SAMN05444141_11349 [Pseudovibrio denitrificans]|uniref:Uncharacterized protein n=1 Tax=Pseudovibrio denitrificans TaxID=258256 RepID=A0A1I7DYW8_9HYPH|nr:hypothetical protein [Pseudovibrio denitrificans]SFU16861.1 hypothetical protein SAMN05444141_11349 [Pseudovibrio denitrificans]
MYNLNQEQSSVVEKIRPNDADFIVNSSGFYQATINSDNRPCIHFRNGPKGFLQVLGERKIAFADYHDLNHQGFDSKDRSSDQISLILMDYAQRRQLKIKGQFSHWSVNQQDLSLFKLTAPRTGKRLRGIIVINVDKLEWRACLDIPVRLSLEELDPQIYKIREELVRLRVENAKLRALS